MTTATTEKPKVSIQDILEQVNDPSIVKALAERVGLKVAETTKAEEPKKREPKLVSLGEKWEPQDLITAINESLKANHEGILSAIQESISGLKTEAKQTEEKKVATTINEKVATLIKEIGDDKYKQIFPELKALFTGGKSFEDAVEQAKKIHGLVKEKLKQEGNVFTKTPPKTSIKSTEQPVDESDLETTFKTTREAAEHNLDRVLEQHELSVADLSPES